MKKLTIAVLFLFATSLFGAAFASGCMATARATEMGTQMQEPTCCAVKAACMGGSCFARVHDAGCTSDHETITASQKSQSAAELIKAPSQTIVPTLLLTTVSHYDIVRPPSRQRDFVHIEGYAGIYERTGRLLI